LSALDHFNSKSLGRPHTLFHAAITQLHDLPTEVSALQTQTQAQTHTHTHTHTHHYKLANWNVN